MAVRIDADGEQYTRSLGLGSVTNWTVTCWAKLSVNRSTTTVVWQIDDGAGAEFLRINAWNGSELTFQSGAAGAWFGFAGFTLVVDQWTYIALSSTANPGQTRSRIRPAGSATFSGGSPTQTNTTFSAGTLRLGASHTTNQWLNGSICAVKVWDTALTELELEQESWTYQPLRTTNLRAWYPLLSPSTVDSSGNGETLSGGSGTTLDDGPPIAWKQGRRRTATPTTTVAGTLAGTLPAATAAAAGTLTVAGTLAGTAPTATAALAGNLTTNYLAGVVPAATASMAAAVKVTAASAATLPAATGALAGDVDIPLNDITVTPGTPARRWTAGSPARGWDAGRAKRGWTATPPT
ncbi:LamG-like jellyroll fold domain-containing protein [Nonomuraea sp. NPDC049646]|uniref:LamG-like jellyroll fold domain-containing protein n=1 Tax=unclassified Nonomuraea TaxID=2593643 RepID=UPI0037AC1FB3